MNDTAHLESVSGPAALMFTLHKSTLIAKETRFSLKKANLFNLFLVKIVKCHVKSVLPH